MLHLRQKHLFVSILLVSVCCFNGAFAAQKQSLFDGKTLNGWYVRGGTATYTVENGTIVGTTVKGSPNTFLCTESDYGDFILDFEVKCDVALNSGVQIRSHASKDNHVFGYQVEIAGSDTASSGGIWDGARRSRWVYQIEKGSPAAKAFKDNQWNQYRVQCIGDHITTWINGVVCSDVIDPMDMTGFIGLQVHSVGGDPKLQVRWKNICITEIGRNVWRPLFDGKTLNGWHALPGGKWEVKEGMLVGTSQSTETRHGLLVSDGIYDDFTVRLKFKALKGDSGFYFRSEESNDAVGVHGFQAQIHPATDIGGLYETNGREWVFKPDAEDVKKYFKPGDWNEMVVSAYGGRIVVHVNNTQVAQLLDDPGRSKGRLALQLHGNQEMEIMFKDIEILTAQKSSVSLPFNGKDLNNWQVRAGKQIDKSKWKTGIAALAANPKMLIAKPGHGEMINLAEEHGQSFDLACRDKFGDSRIEVELMVPEGSNSGVYVMGEYEIQVLDSWGRTKMGSGDMGAVYGAAPPPLNASKKPGEWQKYVIDFNVPRFDSAGKKIANAQLVKVQLNGKVLHENLVLPGPTPGGVSGQEAPKGPIMFQGNHGAVAFRNIRITEFTDIK